MLGAESKSVCAKLWREEKEIKRDYNLSASVVCDTARENLDKVQFRNFSMFWIFQNCIRYSRSITDLTNIVCYCLAYAIHLAKNKTHIPRK